jgi:hypothetical protein
MALCTLSCESMSILTIIGAFPSSSTSVALTGSTCGEGIASTSTIPSVCVNSCSTSAVSCGDLWLLHVFRVVWLGARPLEVPSWVIIPSSIELQLLRSLNSPVRLSSSCSLASRVCKCTICLVWPMFSLYIGHHKCPESSQRCFFDGY